MKNQLISFYNEYVSNGSNITEFAEKNGITPTQCFQLVTMGENYSKI